MPIESTSDSSADRVLFLISIKNNQNKTGTFGDVSIQKIIP